MKYEKMVHEILEAMGGSDNIKDAYHCFTRLRITPKDTSKVNLEALQGIKGIMKVVVTNTQYQCVIGTEVNDVYKDFCEITGIQEKAAVDEKADDKAPKGKKKITPKSIFDAVIDAISGCIQPLLPGIICAGMIKMIVSIFGPAILGWIPEGSDLLTILTMAGDAPFYFLPVMIGYTGAKKFGLNPVTGLILGGLLMHPTWTAIVAGQNPFTVYGIPATLVDYASSVVPMILVTWVASYVEKGLKKIMPNMIKMMTVMPLTILIMLPIEFCALAPLGNIIGTALSSAILAIPNLLGPVGVGIIAALYMILVMFGMHLPVIMAIAVTYFTVGHEDVVLLGGAYATMAVLGMCVGMLLKAKTAKNRELAASCAMGNLFGGVSEPAIYGIMLVFKRTWLYQAIGAAAGAFLASLMHVGVYTITSGANFIAWMGFTGADSHNLVWGCIALVVAFAVPFVLTLVLGFGENKVKAKEVAAI